MSSEEGRPLPRLPRARKKGAAPEGATFLALVGMSCVVMGLVGLVSVVLPAELRVVMILIGFVVGFFGGHYLLWGRWLEGRLRRSSGEQREEFWKTAAPPARIERDDN